MISSLIPKQKAPEWVLLFWQVRTTMIQGFANINMRSAYGVTHTFLKGEIRFSKLKYVFLHMRSTC